MKLWLPLIGCIVLFMLLWLGLNQDPHAVPAALVGKPLPHFSGSTLKNPNKFLSEKQLKGKVSLLNIWASWCDACLEDHTMLMEITQRYRIPIYGINYKDHRDKATQWLQKYGNPYQVVLFDPEGQLGIILGASGTPETYIIDQQGIIRYKHVGPITPEIWRSELWPEIQFLQS